MAPFQISAYKHFKILKDPSITGNLSFPTLYTLSVRTILFRVKNVGFEWVQFIPAYYQQDPDKYT